MCERYRHAVRHVVDREWACAKLDVLVTSTVKLVCVVLGASSSAEKQFERRWNDAEFLLVNY